MRALRYAYTKSTQQYGKKDAGYVIMASAQDSQDILTSVSPSTADFFVSASSDTSTSKAEVSVSPFAPFASVSPIDSDLGVSIEGISTSTKVELASDSLLGNGLFRRGPSREYNLSMSTISKRIPEATYKIYGPPSMNKPVRSPAMLSHSVSITISDASQAIVIDVSHLFAFVFLHFPPLAILRFHICVKVFSCHERSIMEQRRTKQVLVSPH